MNLDMRQFVPHIGEFYTKQAVPFNSESSYPLLKLNSYEYTARFAVQIGDEGLIGWGVNVGDYLIFRRQSWPTENGQLCFIQFGEDSILRIIPDIWNPEVELITTNDLFKPIHMHRNQFIVTGVCYGIKSQHDDIEILYPDSF